MALEEIQGIAFPFRFDPKTGGVARAKGKDKLRQNLIQLLSTTIGERFMERSYGSSVRRLLQDPNNEALQMLIRYEIQKAIMQWEPRIVVKNMDFIPQNAEVEVVLEYSILNQEDRLQFRLNRM